MLHIRDTSLFARGGQKIMDNCDAWFSISKCIDPDNSRLDGDNSDYIYLNDGEKMLFEAIHSRQKRTICDLCENSVEFVSEGEDIKFFNRSAKTTTIPAQLANKYGCSIVPVYIERINKFHFKLYFNKPIKFDDKFSVEQISLELNKILEKMILKKPDQWIWSHNRWK